MATLFLFLTLLVTGPTSASPSPSWIPDGSDAISAGCAARLQARPGVRLPARAEMPALCGIGTRNLIGQKGAYERVRVACRVPLGRAGSLGPWDGTGGVASIDSPDMTVASDCAHVPVQPGRVGR